MVQGTTVASKATTAVAVSTSISYKKIILATVLVASSAYLGYFWYSRGNRKGSTNKKPREKLPEDETTDVKATADPVPADTLKDDKDKELFEPSSDPISSYATEVRLPFYLLRLLSLKHTYI